MDRYRSYDGRRHSTRRRHSAGVHSTTDKSSRRAIKLFICAGLFIVAALMKLVFPSTLTAIGDKLNSVVNYKAALTALGEGISGEKKFTTALGEAITYAFTGESNAAANKDEQVSPPVDQASTATAASDSAAENDAAAISDTAVTDTSADDDAAAVFAEDKNAEASQDAEASATDKKDTLADAVIAAFIQSQEEYSDYAIPAGVTYEMPRISISYDKPVDGVVSSPFGYRVHPVEKTVKFHYGTDIAAKKGTPINAFADGKVIAAGDSTTLGKYVIISHGDVQSEYAHCGSIAVTSGQTVKKGAKIATVGDTGNATECCLHFELKVNGQYVNPEYYVQWK